MIIPSFQVPAGASAATSPSSSSAANFPSLASLVPAEWETSPVHSQQGVSSTDDCWTSPCGSVLPERQSPSPPFLCIPKFLFYSVCRKLLLRTGVKYIFFGYSILIFVIFSFIPLSLYSVYLAVAS